MGIFRRQTFKDQEIIDGILKGGKAEDDALTSLYRENQNTIIRHIIKNNGNEDVAKDIFQDAIIKFSEQVKNGKYVYQPGTKISTFLFRIAKCMWLNELKKMGREHDYRNSKNADDNITDSTPLLRVLEIEKQKVLVELMNTLEKECKQILQYSIYEELSMKEICKRMGYKNEDVAKSKKYKCKEYLKKQIKNTPYLRNLLMN